LLYSCSTSRANSPMKAVVPRPKYYRITLERIPGKYRCSEPLRVTRQSPLKLRKQVEVFAIYFRREFDYAIREFDAKDKDPYTAYLFPDSNANVWIGACCFRPESYAYDVDSETLRWIWLHPYYRMKGVLTEAWPFFKAKHGDFFVEPPLSPGMLSFVLRHCRQSRFFGYYERFAA
jgi:hypothetical protein